MRSLPGFLLVLLLAAPAFAIRPAEPASVSGPPPQLAIDAPSGWQLLPGLSTKLSQTAAATEYFAGEPSESAALAYGRANRGALYLTWVHATRAIPGPEATLRASFDALHQAPYLASPEAGSTQEVSYRERSFDGVAEMQFEWAHMSNGTVNIVRALGWKDDDARVHLAIAECVLPSDMTSESRPLCEAALASLRLTSADHKALAALAEPARAGPERADNFEVPALETSEELPAPAKSPVLGPAPAEVGEVLYDGRKGSGGSGNNRTIIAIGVVLLGVAVYLTTRSRSGEGDDALDEDAIDQPPRDEASSDEGPSDDADVARQKEQEE